MHKKTFLILVDSYLKWLEVIQMSSLTMSCTVYWKCENKHGKLRKEQSLERPVKKWHLAWSNMGEKAIPLGRWMTSEAVQHTPEMGVFAAHRRR